MEGRVIDDILGMDVEERIVAEVGEPLEMGGGHIIPVRFTDGKYGIVVAQDWPYRVWVPDSEHAELAIENSKVLPTLSNGVESGILHVHGEDKTGQFLVKLFYNSKKKKEGRVDELHR